VTVAQQLWHGEVFNKATKHEEGDFAAHLTRELSPDELDDLLIVSKNGWLQVGGKKQASDAIPCCKADAERSLSCCTRGNCFSTHRSRDEIARSSRLAVLSRSALG
jgi:hypothetical protein